jgi:hypothetical protein
MAQAQREAKTWQCLSRRLPIFLGREDARSRVRVKTGNVAMLKINKIVRDMKLAMFKIGNVRRLPTLPMYTRVRRLYIGCGRCVSRLAKTENGGARR